MWRFVKIKLCISLFYLILLSGCVSNQGPPVKDSGASSGQSKTSDQDTRADTRTKPSTVKVTPTPPKNSAAKILLAQADNALKENAPNQAIVLLERAIRIDPREALLWIRLSRAHLAQGQSATASQHARKAIALAGSDNVKSGRAWLQLANVLEAQGERQQAASLRRRYSRYRG